MLKILSGFSWPPALMILAGLLIYAFTNLFCMDNCYGLIQGRFYALQLVGIGLVPTLLVLSFFSKKILILWFNHIAWWFSFLIFWAITNLSDGSWFPAWWIANACMVIFFIVTLVYALIMNKKLKNS